MALRSDRGSQQKKNKVKGSTGIKKRQKEIGKIKKKTPRDDARIDAHLRS